MNEQVQHVVALTADLQTCLHPVEPCGLEELRRLQLTEQILLRHRLLRSRLQLVEDIDLQQFLIRYADLNWLVRWAVF